MNIAEVAELMLKENTGRHMLDSGGAYGRNWERNQGKSFADIPAYSVEFSVWGDSHIEIMVTLQLYHWMCHNLEPDDELQALLDEYAAENPEMSVYELAETFADRLVSGFYVEGVGSQDWAYPNINNTRFNSYNDDNILSQDVLYTPLTDNNYSSYDASHLILQVHGGCDARGGYTMPRCFKLRSEEWDYATTMQDFILYVDGIAPDESQETLPGITPSDHWLGQNTWYIRGQDVDPSDRNDCPEDIFKLPAQELELDQLPTPREEWWIAVTPIEGSKYDKRAYLMPPNIGQLREELEIHASGDCE